MKRAAGFLSPYRALDLTDARGLPCGHMFAQLGADVVQMEPPSGSSARRTPPFAPEWPAGENSLYWAAYASGKRGVTCDPGTEDGRALFLALVRQSDFLFESVAPADGRPDWLDPAYLHTANPRLVHVSITPFGLEGPKAAWAASEITLWGAGGPLLPARDLDDRPLRISAPQAWLHAAGDAAGGALVAHFARISSGHGQHVDISAQQSAPQATLSSVLAAAVGHDSFTPRPPRPGHSPGPKTLDLSGSGARTRRSKWPVADGLAEMHLAMGPPVGESTNRLFAWMREEGALDPRFDDWDWTSLHHRVRAGEITDAMLDEAREDVARFMRTRRKGELMEVALTRGVRVAPVQTIADILTNDHLAARGFLQTVNGPFGDYVLPGDFAFGAPSGFVPLAAAPRLGEHNQEVFGERLGLSADRIARLYDMGAI